MVYLEQYLIEKNTLLIVSLFLKA